MVTQGATTGGGGSFTNEDSITAEYTPSTTNTPATPGAGLDLSQLRFRFDIRHYTISTPGTAEFRIYNLAASTANLVQREFTRIQLSVGYQDNLGLIFDGTITQARIGRESQVDTVLTLTAVEQDVAQSFACINQTLAAGSTPDDRLNAILKALAPLGVTKGYVPSPLPGARLPRGIVMSGMVRDYLRSLAAEVGCDWSIKSDHLNLLPFGEHLPSPAIVLTSRTGMVGLPEQTLEGIVVRCLINPDIVPGRAIQIDQKSVQQIAIGTNVGDQVNKVTAPGIEQDGLYRTLLVSHSGDSRGNDWYSTITATGLHAPIPLALGSRTPPATIPADTLVQLPGATPNG